MDDVSERRSAPPRAVRVRRRFPAEFKREMVEQATRPGASLAAVARQHDLNANQLQKWRRQLSGARFVPVAVEPVAEGRSRWSGVEIEVCGGHRIRLPEPIDPAMLKVVIAALLR